MNQNKRIIMDYYRNELLNYDKDFYNQYGIYVKPHGYSLSSRKIESYIQIAHIQKYLQCNPVKAIDLFFNIELLDGQALLVQRSWICPNVLAEPLAKVSPNKKVVLGLITSKKPELEDKQSKLSLH